MIGLPEIHDTVNAIIEWSDQIPQLSPHCTSHDSSHGRHSQWEMAVALVTVGR